MRRSSLGKSGTVVSDSCMGTMTFGTGADEKASFEILDMAHDFGNGFYDKAGMYSVPPDKSYAGPTKMLGRWMTTRSSDS